MVCNNLGLYCCNFKYGYIPPSPLEFSAGEIVEALIGFTNEAEAEAEFVVTGIEASFRFVVSCL